MGTKSVYEPPKIINLMCQSAEGQQVSQMGQCADGTSPTAWGCNAGLDVVTGKCTTGDFPTLASCSSGSRARQINECWQGTSA